MVSVPIHSSGAVIIAYLSFVGGYPAPV